jgi:hypothetical protein
MGKLRHLGQCITCSPGQVWSTELSKSILNQANPSSQQVAFDPSKSSTFKKLDGETWSISYGDSSSASGDVGTDVVNLGGLKVENQAVELAKELSQQFAQVRFSPHPNYVLLTPLGQRKWPTWPRFQLHQHRFPEPAEDSSGQHHRTKVCQGAAIYRIPG